MQKRGNGRKLTLQDVIDRSNIVHDYKYDYSNSIYTSTSDKMEVICPNHGSFLVMVSNHFRKRGCPECKAINNGNRLRSNTEEFLQKCREIHGDRYDLSEVIYGKNAQDKVKARCNEHGVFSIRPSHFLNGGGCPSCSSLAFSDSKPLWIYVLNTTTGVTKIGISKKVETRCKALARESKLDFKIVCKMLISSGRIAFEIEQEILKELKINYTQLCTNFVGATECFYEVPETLIEQLIVEKLLSRTKSKDSSNTSLKL